MKLFMLGFDDRTGNVVLGGTSLESFHQGWAALQTLQFTNDSPNVDVAITVTIEDLGLEYSKVLFLAAASGRKFDWIYLDYTKDDCSLLVRILLGNSRVVGYTNDDSIVTVDFSYESASVVYRDPGQVVRGDSNGGVVDGDATVDPAQTTTG